MKNLLLAFSVLWCSSAFAQSPVVAEGGWVPMVVYETKYVPYQYAVTNYYASMVPVSVPTTQYVFVVSGANQYQPVKPVVQVVRPCLFPWGRFYYEYIPVKY